MTLFSAFDDFVARTLSAIPGVMSKLMYVSGLRSPAGTYEHWGLAKSHGASAAQSAIAQAHSAMFLEVLRTPLRALAEDWAQGAVEPTSGPRPVAELRPDNAALLPANLAGGSRKHFNSVLEALSSVARASTVLPPRAA